MKKRIYIFSILLLVTLLACSCGKKKQDAEIKNTSEVTESEKEDTKKDSKEEGKEEDSEGEEAEGQKTEEEEADKKDEAEESSESETDNQQKSTTEVEQSNSSGSSQNKTQASSGQATANTKDKYIVNRVTEVQSEQTSPFKYGIVKKTVVTNTYAVYNDGSKVLENSSSSESYDASGYKASNDELKAESESNASKYNSYYQEVLRLVNQIRAEAGVAPMVLDDTLCKAASMRAVEMNYSGYFSHTRPNGESCFSVLSYYNISYYTCGENIAAGYRSPAAVVEGWKNSSGHYANMIDANFGKLGVGYSASFNTSSPQWVQLFTN